MGLALLGGVDVGEPDPEGGAVAEHLQGVSVHHPDHPPGEDRGGGGDGQGEGEGQGPEKGGEVREQGTPP